MLRRGEARLARSSASSAVPRGAHSAPFLDNVLKRKPGIQAKGIGGGPRPGRGQRPGRAMALARVFEYSAGIPNPWRTPRRDTSVGTAIRPVLVDGSARAPRDVSAPAGEPPPPHLGPGLTRLPKHQGHRQSGCSTRFRGRSSGGAASHWEHAGCRSGDQSPEGWNLAPAEFASGSPQARFRPLV
jgi:hypothetical protein